MIDHFGNDPRGVSEQTQVRIDEFETMKADYEAMLRKVKDATADFASKYAMRPDVDCLITASQWIEDAFHKDMTDVESRIGRE
jgi:hypothetical protein